MIYSLIISLFLTIILELSSSLILGIKSKNDILVCILVNTFTNPLVVFIANLVIIYGNQTLYNIVITILEISVVFVEFKLYKDCLKEYKKSPFVLSLINNVFSYSMGFIVNRFI